MYCVAGNLVYVGTNQTPNVIKQGLTGTGVFGGICVATLQYQVPIREALVGASLVFLDGHGPGVAQMFFS